MYDNYGKITREEQSVFDISLNARARRRLSVNNYFKNGNEFVFDFIGDYDEVRIPNYFKSYFLKVKVLTSTSTEDEDFVYDSRLYDSMAYDGEERRVWEEANITTSIKFVGNDEDYDYIIITFSSTLTNPRVIVKYE